MSLEVIHNIVYFFWFSEGLTLDGIQNFWVCLPFLFFSFFFSEYNFC